MSESNHVTYYIKCLAALAVRRYGSSKVCKTRESCGNVIIAARELQYCNWIVIVRTILILQLVSSLLEFTAKAEEVQDSSLLTCVRFSM